MEPCIKSRVGYIGAALQCGIWHAGCTKPAFGVHMHASVPLEQPGKARHAPQLSADCKVNCLFEVRLRTALHCMLPRDIRCWRVPRAKQ